MIKWDKLIHKNRTQGDCQLVTAVNAYRILNNDYDSMNNDEYNELIDLCGSRYGAAISIKKVWRKLGLVEKARIRFRSDLDRWLKPKGIKYPIETMIWHKAYGLHSVLIVDYDRHVKAFRITNFRWATSLDGWIFDEDLNHFLHTNANKTKPLYQFCVIGRRRNK